MVQSGSRDIRPVLILLLGRTFPVNSADKIAINDESVNWMTHRWLRVIHLVWWFESNTTLAFLELLDIENLPHEAPGAPKIFGFESLNIFSMLEMQSYLGKTMIVVQDSLRWSNIV